MTPLQQTGFPDLQLLTRCSAKDFLWLYPPAIQLLPLSSPTTSYYIPDEARSDAPTTSEQAPLYLVMHLLGSYPVPLPPPPSGELAATPPAAGYWLLPDARARPRPRTSTPVYASCISGYGAGATGVLRVWGHRSVLRRSLTFVEPSQEFQHFEQGMPTTDCYVDSLSTLTSPTAQQTRFSAFLPAHHPLVVSTRAALRRLLHLHSTRWHWDPTSTS